MRSNSERKGKTKPICVTVPQSILHCEPMRTTELPGSIVDFCLQSTSLLSGCSMARAGSKGSHGTDLGRDLPWQPCPSVTSRAAPEVMMGHTKNLLQISAYRSPTQDFPKPLWEPTRMTISYPESRNVFGGENEAGRKTLSVTLGALLTALSLS